MDKNIFADLHCHILYGLDDGAKDVEDMKTLLRESFLDGVRYLCFTPHFHPGIYGDNGDRAKERFEEAKEYAKEMYPEMQLFLGNELHYNQGSRNWVRDGKCHRLGDSKYVLVDFSEDAKLELIEEGIHNLLSGGYKTILAHAERYIALYKRLDVIDKFRMDGVLIQLDAGSILGDFGLRIKKQSKLLLKCGLVDFVSSDTHDTMHRRTRMTDAYEVVSKKYGEEYAKDLFLHTALKVMDIKQ